MSESRESLESEQQPSVSIEDRSSVISMYCRICYDDTLDEPVITPCHCKGTIGLIHKSCLETWLAESNTSTCDLCHAQFNIERTMKYPVGKSICVWLRKSPADYTFDARDVRIDLLVCSLLTPLAIILIHICMFSVDYYDREEYYEMSPVRWTSASIMIMGLVILLGYVFWLHLLIHYHVRLWFFWWQRQTVVKVKLDD